MWWTLQKVSDKLLIVVLIFNTIENKGLMKKGPNKSGQVQNFWRIDEWLNTYEDLRVLFQFTFLIIEGLNRGVWYAICVKYDMKKKTAYFLLDCTL